MTTREDLIKKANEWAELTWDESDLPEDEKSEKSQLDMCKACGSLGWSRGYECGQKDFSQEVEGRSEFKMYRAGYENALKDMLNEASCNQVYAAKKSKTPVVLFDALSEIVKNLRGKK